MGVLLPVAVAAAPARHRRLLVALISARPWSRPLQFAHSLPIACCVVLCSALLQLLVLHLGLHIWAKVMLFWACSCTASAVAFICF